MRPKISIAVMAALLIIASAMVRVRHVSAQSRYGANYFPNVLLTTQDGKTVKFYDDLVKGKIVAVNLIYTKCQYSCPLETARMAQVQRLLGDHVGKDIFFYSISIDPKRDTPAELKAYAEKYHAGPGWLFLTGKKEDIDVISKKLGLYADPSINDDGHTTYLMLGDEPNGQWMRESSVDNPKFLADAMNDFITHGRGHVGNGKSYAQAAALNMTPGQYLFATRCTACHTIGHGSHVGPDLLGVTNVRDRKWLLRFIQQPDKMLAEKDPIAVALYKNAHDVQMPNLQLGNEDVIELVKFLAAQDAAHKPESSTAATTKGKSGQ